MRRSHVLAIVITSLVLTSVAWFVYSAKEVATGQMGMLELKTPSGASLWVRRQSYAHTREQLYISANSDYCAPYRSGDYRLPPPITGSPQNPMLISFSGSTLVVHAPDSTHSRSQLTPKLSQARLEPLTTVEYQAYVDDRRGERLPEGWQSIEVKWGRNTCSL